ncbi:MAG: tol-pal system protein YbgF [Sandaracinaceae bacterium]
MTRRLTLLLVLALGGCTSAAPRASTAPTARALASHAPRGAEAEELQEQRDRVRELEAQLGLAQATSRELRDEVEALRVRAARRSTRIGRTCAAGEEAHVESNPVAEPAAVEPRSATRVAERSDVRRPVLRIHGAAPRPAMNANVAALPGPAAPPVVGAPPVGAARLPVVAGAPVPAIPVTPLVVAPSPAPVAAPSVSVPAPVAPTPPPDGAAEAYREALRHLSERRPSDALAGIDAFLQRYPSHPYADNALYWRGEIHYVRRDFRQALRSFGELLERYPDGNKVPDALLRMGLCYRRLGQEGRAARVFDRLRAQYPQSVAARMTSQEDA